MKLEASSRLRLRDILVLRLSQVAEDEEEALSSLAENLSGLCNIPIIVLRDGMSIESMSEATMAQAGWVRIERRGDGQG